MLGMLKKLLKRDETPEVVKLFGKAKTEREALLLLKEARKRDEDRRREANLRLSGITGEEQVLMSEGKQEDTSDGRRHFLARRIKELRDEQKSIEYKVDKIYNPRLKALNQHIQSLETVIEVKSEPLPTLSSMEEVSIKASTMMGELDEAVELAKGIQNPFMERGGADDEEKAIMAEMEELRDQAKEKERKSKEKEAAGKKKEKPVVAKDYVKELDEELLEEGR